MSGLLRVPLTVLHSFWEYLDTFVTLFWDIVFYVVLGDGAFRVGHPWAWCFGFVASFWVIAGAVCAFPLWLLGLVLPVSPWIAILPGCAIPAIPLIRDVAPYVLHKEGRFVEFRGPGADTRFSIRSVPIFANQCIHIVRAKGCKTALAFAVACESPWSMYVLGMRGNNLCLKLYGTRRGLRFRGGNLFRGGFDWTAFEVAFTKRRSPKIRLLGPEILDTLEPVSDITGKDFLVLFEQGPDPSVSK